MAMFNKIKQIKDLRDQAKTLQNALSTESAEGSAEWDKIKVVMNGNQEVTSVTIDASLMSPDNKSKVEKGLAEATNKAIKKVQKVMAEKMKSSGFDFGGMLKQ